MEVLVCDDGSTDDTAARFRNWEARDARVRYLRLEVNTGSPAAARNLGTWHARGEWVAYLDDDDMWLPGKLAAQLEHVEAADVIGTNGLRSDGSTYFPVATSEWRPSRSDLLRDNPFIVSSVLARRSAVQQAGGFPTSPWTTRVADYATWLAVADMDARCIVLGEPLVAYEDADHDRMSESPMLQELAVARMFWQRWIRSPGDRAALRSAAGKTVDALRLAVESPSRSDDANA